MKDYNMKVTLQSGDPLNLKAHYNDGTQRLWFNSTSASEADLGKLLFKDIKMIELSAE